MIKSKSSRMIPDWVTLSQTSGIGPVSLDVRTPSWKGRMQREALIPFVKAGSEKTAIATIYQKGISLISVIPTSVKFPAEGGERKITVSTNADTINAVLSSVEELMPRGEIVDMTIQDTKIDVNGTGLNYGVPGDPGADGLFSVVFTLKMPENKDREIIREKLVINAEQINITQEASNLPYIIVDPETIDVTSGSGVTEFNVQSNIKYRIRVKSCSGAPDPYIEVNPDSFQLDGSSGNVSFNVESNTKYFIRVKECHTGEVPKTLQVHPTLLTLDSDGGIRYFDISVSDQSMNWNITKKN